MFTILFDKNSSLISILFFVSDISLNHNFDVIVFYNIILLNVVIQKMTNIYKKRRDKSSNI